MRHKTRERNGEERLQEEPQERDHGQKEQGEGWCGLERKEGKVYARKERGSASKEPTPARDTLRKRNTDSQKTTLSDTISSLLARPQNFRPL